MKIIKFCLIACLIFCSVLTITACNDRFGGLSLSPNDTVIGGTIFDTKNLKLVQADITGETNYAVKVIGSTTPLNDQSWEKWFQDQESDVSGKIAVALRLEYTDEIASDPNATLTLPASTTTTETKSYILSEITDGRIDNNYIYIILNPKHDIVTMNIDYMADDEHKDITYTIDMINVNTDSNRLE